MNLQVRDKIVDMCECVCELTKELDKLSKIDKSQYYEWFYHYLLTDEWHKNHKCMSIRVPGGTVGTLYYDDYYKITELGVDTDYVIKTYPKDVNEIIQKYIGEKIEGLESE